MSDEEHNLGITRHVPLGPLTTFACGGSAEYFARAETADALPALYEFARTRGLPVTILGGGSNVLIQDGGISGLVTQIAMTDVSTNGVRMTLGAGENWNVVTAHAARKGLYGIETLAAIPGTVGGAVVQNIGAYGGEICQAIESVDVFDPKTAKRSTLTAAECQFSYRMSVFKKAEGRHLVVLGCTLRLSDIPPQERVLYPDVEKYFKTKHDGVVPYELTPTDIRDAVTAIRAAKLPDWNVLGTAGSYFKNPIISIEQYGRLKEQYAELPSFAIPGDGTQVKVPLAWIIDHVCGLKGYRKGPVGIYEKQAIVLVNYGGAKAADVRNLEHFIVEEVKNKTGISIEREVEVMGSI